MFWLNVQSLVKFQSLMVEKCVSEGLELCWRVTNALNELDVVQDDLE